jgi:putative endonuclease
MKVDILFSEKSSRYYVGQTADIDKRLKRHNQGLVRSTKGGIPWKIVLQIDVLNRSEAVVLERKIKKRGAKRYLDNQFGVYHAKAWQVSPGQR